MYTKLNNVSYGKYFEKGTKYAEAVVNPTNIKSVAD